MTAQDALTEVMLRTDIPPLIFIVTGSRDWTDRRSVWSPLNRVRLRNPGRRIVVRNGKAKKGVDLLVSQWTDRYARLGAEEDPHPADWDTWGNGAGHRRNKEMVDAGGAFLMAWANPCNRRRPWCPPGVHPSHGTADCVEQARDARIPVFFSPAGMSW